MTDLLQLPGGALGQVCAEVLAALSAEEPRSNRDIFDACPSALEAMDLSKAFYTLRQRGLIVEAGRAEPPKGRGSRSGKTYLLGEAAANARLAEHLERELAESLPFSPPETALAERVAEAALDPEAGLDADWPDALYDALEDVLDECDPDGEDHARMSEGSVQAMSPHGRWQSLCARIHNAQAQPAERERGSAGASSWTEPLRGEDPCRPHRL